MFVGSTVELVDDLEDAGEADYVFPLDAADGLHGSELRSAAEGDGFDFALPFQQVGDEGAGRAALAVGQEEVVGEGVGNVWVVRVRQLETFHAPMLVEVRVVEAPADGVGEIVAVALFGACRFGMLVELTFLHSLAGN